MGRRYVSVLAAAGLAAGALVASAAPVGAATFTVTSTADDGSPNSLRWAVSEANASPGDDVIDIVPGLTDIDLVDCTAGRLEVAATGSLTINGNDVVLKQTCPAHGVLGGAGSLTLDGVTVTGGTAAGDGGGISLTGALTVVDSTVSFNASVGAGGGIRADQVTVVDSEIADNFGGSVGGGIYATDEVRIDGSAVRSNHANYPGGGVYSVGDIAVVDSTVEANDAQDGAGVIGNGAVEVRGSRIANNRALQFGGGILGDEVELVDSVVVANYSITGPGGVGGSDVTVTDSTITENTSEYSGGLSAVHVEITGSAITGNAASKYNSAIRASNGGTITRSTVAGNTGPGPTIDTGFMAQAPLTLDHATIVGNTGGFGILLHQPFRSYGSVVALNGSSACVFGAGSGEVYSDGYSVSGDTSCGFNNPTDLTGVGDPLLGTLGFHDGPTPNLVPLSGSPVLNRIPSSDPRCTGVDQRGFGRPANGACDVGATEVRAVSSTGTSVTTPFETPVDVDLVPLVTDPDGVLSKYDVEGGTSGTVDAADGGVVTYTPGVGFTGTDSYTYVVCSVGDVICTAPAAVSVAVGAGPVVVPVVVTPRFTG